MSVNRSEEIRRFFEQNPGARPKECIIALAARGIDVSPTLVSCVRAKLKERVSGRDMASDVSVVRGFVDSSGLDPEVAVEILTRFVGVVDKVGGLDRFREVLAEMSPGGGGQDDDGDGPRIYPTPTPTPELTPTPEVTPTPTPEVTPDPTPEVTSVFGDAAFFYDDVNDEDDD